NNHSAFGFVYFCVVKFRSAAVKYTVAAAAGAGVGDDYHEETLHVLGLLSPMVEVRKAGELG
ncbi:hypothetical protein, partial [Streptomyces sp. NPDC000994]